MLVPQTSRDGALESVTHDDAADPVGAAAKDLIGLKQWVGLPSSDCPRYI